MCRDCDQQLYNDLRIFKLVFCIYLLADVLQELNVLSKKIQTENVDLNQLGAQIELTTRSLTRMFLDAENFGGDSKYIKTFIEVAEDGFIEYKDKTGTIHNLLCFSNKFQVVEIRAILLMLARGWQKNIYKLLSIPYMPSSLICGYSTPPKYSTLFLILWSCHFYIGMHTYGYKSCLITFV
jgi:hypothetical protein